MGENERSEMTKAQHCCVFIFPLDFFPLENNNKDQQEKLNEITESSKGTLIFI